MDGKKWDEGPVPVNEFIEDMESALLELIEAGFQAAIPNADPPGL